MKAIFKYRLEVVDTQTVELPKGAQVLSVEVQQGIICVWAIVNPEEKATEAHVFSVVGTGNPYGNDRKLGQFLGTVFMAEQMLVWHVFHLAPMFNV